jgi:hypothetical protein
MLTFGELATRCSVYDEAQQHIDTLAGVVLGTTATMIMGTRPVPYNDALGVLAAFSEHVKEQWTLENVWVNVGIYRHELVFLSHDAALVGRSRMLTGLQGSSIVTCRIVDEKVIFHTREKMRDTAIEGIVRLLGCTHCGNTLVEADDARGK